MVERIPKIDVDRMRVQRKEEADDEQGSGSHPDPQSDEEEKKSHFSPKLDFKKAMGEESRAGTTHQTLWQQPTSSQRDSSAQTKTSMQAQESYELEEETHSTTITFLRAVGLVKMSGRLNWATISLYTFAFIGFISTVIFLLNALL